MAGLAALFAAVALVAAALLFQNTSYAQRALVDFMAARTGRSIRVDGPLEVHLLSPRPSFSAERVTIGNPPWMPPGTMAQVGKVSMEFDPPVPGRTASIRRVQLDEATLHLVRDAEGRANWQSRPPGTPRGGPGRLIRSLSMPNARLDLDDARRHLQFSGTVSAGDVSTAGAGGPPLLRIEGTGQLNGQPAAFAFNADPLATASRKRPYRFAYAERSGGARLEGRGALLQPFDVGVLDSTFEASGASMRDVYHLVGLSLPNTAPFTLSGKLARRGPQSTFDDLMAHFGESDAHGRVTLQIVNGRPQFNADLSAGLLKLSDFGRHNPDGSSVHTAARTWLLPDTQLPLTGLRHRDWIVRFRADTVVAGPMSLRAFDANATIDQGVMVVPSFATVVRDAKVTGNVRIDANDETPKTEMDVKISGLRLGRFSRKALAQAPLDGLLRARVQITGRGTSIHQIAASANGTVTAVLPRGAMRESLAELTGVNLRGLGLMLAKNDEETPVRCAVASFQAHDGTLNAQHFIIDTDPMLITGAGAIHLDSEALDLTLRGRPKKMRLVRMHSPVYVRGSLRHPSFGVSAGRIAAQTGGAVALGIALTPIAAVLALVDPGLAKDADCSALLDQNRSDAMHADTKHPRGESAKR